MPEARPSAPERIARGLVFVLAGVFVLVNLTARAHAIHAAPGAASGLVLAVVGLVTAVCLAWPSLTAAALQLLGASFFLYGFHSYRLQSQVFELAVTAFALVLLVRLVRGPAAPAVVRGTGVPLLAVAYALVADTSLLLLPAAVLEHRFFLEGVDVGRAILDAFPKDPLYPIASVNRLWLFGLFAVLVTAQRDARELFSKLFRGIAWAVIAAVVLGVADFGGLLSLDRYNLSNLFYGAQYRRLQSTFGNPSWFACFVACALPFLLLEFHHARARGRWALAVVFPLCAASLFLSGARAAWLAVLVVLASLVVAALAMRRWGRPLARPDGPTWLALGSTLATVAALVVTALLTPTTIAPGADSGPPGRLEGLSRELQYRGLGLTSPRRVAAAYALELARLAPVRGLGYESYNLHLRAQLAIPGSGVANVVNTALAADASETVFDDSHNTYLQVLTGTGALGLSLWLGLAFAGLRAAARAFRHDGSPETLAALVGMVVFHFYGLFQGMAYIPATFFLLPLMLGHVVVLDPGPDPVPERRGRRWWLPAFLLLGSLVAASYASDSGFASLKRRFGVTAYLPDEAAEYEGFYRPETGASGEYRWMRERAIVNVRRSAPFRLSFACEHPDLEREPVVLSLRFEGRDAGQIVFRRPGAVEQRFAFGEPGALRLTVSRTFRPGAGDRRELGIAVSAIRWE